MTLEGIDTINRIPPDVLKANGKSFVCRYLPIPGKTNIGYTITQAEADALLGSGIALVLNHETTGKTYRGGYDAGVVDGTDALRACSDIGLAGSPVIFSVDEDTNDYATINRWLDGCGSVLGREHCGLYHKYESIESALGEGHCRYGWQTYAWSRGQISNRAHIYQYNNDVQISGYSCDLNRTVVSDTDFGQVGTIAQPEPPQKKGIPKLLLIDAGKGVSIPVRGWSHAYLSGPNVPVSWNLSGRVGDENGTAGWAPYEFPVEAADTNLWIQNKGENAIVISFA